MMTFDLLEEARGIAQRIRTGIEFTIKEVSDKGEKSPDWRMEAMLVQVVKEGAIPILVAKDLPMREGFCFSCGDRLQGNAQYRCAPCVLAATLVVEAAR